MGADASTSPRCWDLSSGNKKWIIQVPILASIVVSRGGHRAGWGCGQQGPIEASLDHRVRAPRPEKQLIPIPVQMGKLRTQGAPWRGSGRESPGRAVGPSVLAPHPSGAQPRDAALPHAHSSTSSSSSILSVCSPPSCGKPMPAGVTRGSNTGEPCLPCPGSSEFRAIQPQHHVQKAKKVAPRMSLFQGKDPAPDSLAGPTLQ